MPNLLALVRPHRWSGIAGVALASLTVTAGSALAAAAEAPHGGEHGGGGLPQLNPATFPTQIFWLAVVFITLYWLLSKKALPRVAEVLEERQERISRDLGKAGALKDEAETVMAGVETSLAEARSKAQAEIGRASAEIEAAHSARQQQLGADVAERLRQAEARILAAKQDAVANVRSAAADIARDVAARLAGVDSDPAKAEAAVAAVMEERG